MQNLVLLVSLLLGPTIAGGLLLQPNSMNVAINSISTPVPSDCSDIRFILTTPSNPSTSTILKPNDECIRSLANCTSLKMLAHGWTPNMTNWNCTRKHYKGYYVILVDWSARANKLYTEAKESVPYVGECLAKLVMFCMEKNLNSIRIVGHSLGAHVAGSCGNKTGGYISRIIGLDPAFPLYSEGDVDNRLNQNNAIYVVGVHTCGGTYGVPFRIGRMDIWVNGGSPPQPGCKTEDPPTGGFCSHKSGNTVWVYCLLHTMVATKCDSMENLSNGACNSNPKTVMGENMDPSATGDYFMKTGSCKEYEKENDYICNNSY